MIIDECRMQGLHPVIPDKGLVVPSEKGGIVVQSVLKGQIGRFRVVRELGRGSQGRVCLAEDPHLDRRVAIKILNLHVTDQGPQSRQLINEARTVSKFQHPNIISVFDAGEHDGAVYVVYEYVDGITLKDLIAHKGKLNVEYAARLMSQILDAVAYAHENGIVHRDLKPSNILIDRKDTPRILDFGIAVMTGSEPDLSGTMGYMSPEHLASQSLGPQSDLFSLGLIFYEMLTGRPVFDVGSDLSVLYRIAFDPVDPPSSRNNAVDARIDQIVMRAIEKQPELRYSGAVEMKREIDRYLNPDEDGEVKPVSAKTHGTVDFLVRRMSRMKDFPTFSQNIIEINQKTSGAKTSSTSASELANVILRDYSITSKLIKLVNSAFYGQLSGKITTVSRAVVVLGFEQVRITAISLMLFEQLQNHSQATELKDSAINAFMSGLIAGKMAECISAKGVEESFICGMMHNLGRHLVIFYFPEEYAAIRIRMSQKDLPEQAASISVLGIPYEELAIEVLKIWNFPESIIGSLTRLPPGKVERPKSEKDALKAVANYANSLCDIIRTSDGEERAESIKALAGRFRDCVPINERQITGLLQEARERMVRYADILNIDIRKSELLNRLSQEREKVLTGPDAAPPEGEGYRYAPSTGAPAEQKELSTDEEIENVLIEGIQEVSNVLLGEAQLNDILFMILETMYRGFGFQRVVLCIADAQRTRMAARFAFGIDTQYILNHFSFKLGASPDIFTESVLKNRDIVVNDAEDAEVRQKIPDWYRRLVGAPSFAVYPIVVREKPIGMFYADKAQKGNILAGNQAVYMKTLRNQAVLAIKQVR